MDYMTLKQEKENGILFIGSGFSVFYGLGKNIEVARAIA